MPASQKFPKNAHVHYLAIVQVVHMLKLIGDAQEGYRNAIIVYFETAFLNPRTNNKKFAVAYAEIHGRNSKGRLDTGWQHMLTTGRVEIGATLLHLPDVRVSLRLGKVFGMCMGTSLGTHLINGIFVFVR